MGARLDITRLKQTGVFGEVNQRTRDHGVWRHFGAIG